MKVLPERLWIHIRSHLVVIRDERSNLRLLCGSKILLDNLLISK
jgi:hypothetical protein